MYQVFLGLMPLPIAPSKLTTTVGNRSQTVELINGDEYNIIKGAKLQEISLDFMIPAQDYPFMSLAGGLVGSVLGGATGAVTSTAMFEYLEKLKADKKPFNFICMRLGEGFSATGIYNTTLKVTLEDYTILEDANNGNDYMVSVKLKEYRAIVEKVYNSNGSVSKERPK